MMYDVFIIVTLPLLWITLNVFSFIIIWLYELGHAIPALIFTRKPVAIYIGTYGDSNSKKLGIGRLSIYIKPKFAYLKQNGICIYDTEMSFSKQAITLLGGPAILLVLVIITIVELFFNDINLYSGIILGIALLVLLVNLAINVFPRKLLVKSSKRLHYSDGYQLILMIEDKNNYANIISACQYYDEENYEKALFSLKKIKHKYMEESLFSLMLSCYIKLEHYGLAKKLQKDYEHAKWQESVTADEYYLFGYADLQLKHYAQALVNFDKATSLNANHFDSRNGRAFVYNILKDYAMAKEEATKAIFLNENSSQVFSHRAYANFMLGKTGEAFTDADKALILDPSNPYAWLAMGMYLMDKGKTEKALENFERAKQLEPKMLYVDDYLARIKLDIKPVKAKSAGKSRNKSS
jgi:tetratricopeptide (TPR) repeat protein